MKFVKYVKTIGLLFVLLGSQANAYAAVNYLRPYFNSGNNDLGDFAAGNTYAFIGGSLFNGDSFDQSFSFSLTGNNSLDVKITDIKFQPFIEGSDLQYSLFNSGNAITGVNSFFNNLTTGDYLLRVTGNVSGWFGSAYSASINVSAVSAISAVPEPEEWAMLLAGLCLVTLKFSRNSQEELVAL
jgi:hypothetical protein